jgi:DNA-binding MarR family transcriptional regulator
VPERPPLPTLLSQLLVAFTIEFDNEFEHLMPHRTTRGQRSGGPWLVSQAMWVNLMRWLGPEGLTLREGAGLLDMTNLGGMQRWGYVDVAPDPADDRRAPPRSDWVLRPRPAGRRAQETWTPLGRVIEGRWAERFGDLAVTGLRSALESLLAGLSDEAAQLPAYLPVVWNEMFSVAHPPPDVGPARPADHAEHGDHAEHRDDVSALIARVLLAFTLEFEGQRLLALPIGANVLRVLDESPTKLSALPVLTGVSKEAVSMSLTVLDRHRLAVTEPDPSAARGQAVHLTARGRQAQDRVAARLDAVELGWRERLGAPEVAAARTAAEAILRSRHGDGDADGDGDGDAGTTAGSRVAEGLRPYPDGWRARAPYLGQTKRLLTDPLGNLPHHPMVLHRGGWPDGS